MPRRVRNPVADPVGMREIASRLSVPLRTVQSWRFRQELPEPRWMVSARPAWDWPADIVPWVKSGPRPQLVDRLNGHARN